MSENFWLALDNLCTERYFPFCGMQNMLFCSKIYSDWMNLILTHIGAQFRGVSTPEEWRIKTLVESSRVSSSTIGLSDRCIGQIFTTSKLIFVFVLFHQLLWVEQHLVSFQISNFYIGWHFIFYIFEMAAPFTLDDILHFWNEKEHLLHWQDDLSSWCLSSLPVNNSSCGNSLKTY